MSGVVDLYHKVTDPKPGWYGAIGVVSAQERYSQYQAHKRMWKMTDQQFLDIWTLISFLPVPMWQAEYNRRFLLRPAGHVESENLLRASDGNA